MQLFGGYLEFALELSHMADTFLLWNSLGAN